MAVSNATRDAIANLQKEAAVFSERLATVEKSLDRQDIVLVRERLAKLEERSDKLARDRDESSRRWVQFGLLAAGAAVTVGVQLLIRWVGK